ncbi:hypothetical protein H310_14785 [Aphanomyces invadans]|uniref:Transposase Tc1-like domain-containing protein n=1 Tax=Aphanomyces invadans TaxID=157072 RepID=A0A024T8Y9_9STRA|nr:hypothetical protein H310_14785 [Aphanomyces invadans]ETV90434.1 hypothetical protein H310_14785 [Aphanomyces invadans]|eukprot:XP_008880936.1 hypothetical protein H310_14785 [Aphanomyces invadans]
MEDQVKRTHRELSRDVKVAVIQHHHPFLVKGKLQRGAYKQVAEKLSLSPRTNGRLYLAQILRPRHHVQQNAWKRWTQTNLHGPLTAATGLSPATLNRHLKGGTFEQRSTRIKPLLTDENKAERVAFCRSLALAEIDGGAGLPDPDESINSTVYGTSCFLMRNASTHTKTITRCSLPLVKRHHGALGKASASFQRSCSFVLLDDHALMTNGVCVVFSGKIGLWPFVQQVPALRNSRNRPAGTMVTKLVKVDAAVYLDFVINKVIPVIKASFSSASKQVLLQHDNATPHGSITDAVLEGMSTDGWTFKIRKQPPNCPDLNVLDLGFFASIRRLGNFYQ